MSETRPTHNHAEGGRCIFCAIAENIAKNIPDDRAIDLGVPGFYARINNDTVPPSLEVVPFGHRARPYEGFDGKEFEDFGKAIGKGTDLVRDPQSGLSPQGPLEQGFSDWWRESNPKEHLVWRITPLTK